MDLEKAKAELFDNNYTCVLCRGENVHTSRLRGVKPLVTWYVGGNGFYGFLRYRQGGGEGDGVSLCAPRREGGICGGDKPFGAAGADLKRH